MTKRVKDAFNSSVSKQASTQGANAPDPAKVLGSGIKTRASLNWLEAKKQKPPQPNYTISNREIRNAADREAENERLRIIQRMREALEKRSRKGRKDFGTASRMKGLEPER